MYAFDKVSNDISEEEKRAYISHSTMQPVKGLYKIGKFIESAMNIHNPDYERDVSIDDL